GVLIWMHHDGGWGGFAEGLELRFLSRARPRHPREADLVSGGGRGGKARGSKRAVVGCPREEHSARASRRKIVGRLDAADTLGEHDRRSPGARPAAERRDE